LEDATEFKINVGNTWVRTISKQPSAVQRMMDEEQLENVDYFNYLGSTVTNDGRCTYEIKFRISRTKAAFNKKRALLARKLDVNLRNILVTCYIWNIYSYGAESWTFLKVDQKHLKNFVIWRCRRLDICFIVRVRNEEV